MTYSLTLVLALVAKCILRKPGVPPLATLQTLLPNLGDEALKEMDKAALLAALEISTKEKVAKTCYIGPPIVEPANTTDNATDAAAAEAGAGSRRKRSAGATPPGPGRVEGVSMLIPRDHMTGVQPQPAAPDSTDPIMDVETATLCRCEKPATTLRKNVVVNQFVWIPGFSDPMDFDFQGQKGKWEELLNQKISSFPALADYQYGSVTILSMKQDEFSDTSIHIETEVMFGVEANGTDIADALDKINFGSQYTSNLTVGAYCNLGNLSSAFPEEEPFLTLDAGKSVSNEGEPKVRENFTIYLGLLLVASAC